MAKYFNYFPKTSYTFDGKNIQYVTNLLSKVSFENDFKENSVIYYEYLVWILSASECSSLYN